MGSLRDHVSFAPFYLLLIPVGLLLAREQLRERTAATALLAGGRRAAALAVLLARRAPQLPDPGRDAAADRRCSCARASPADVVVVPLLLLAVAVEVTQGAVFQAVWSDAVAARLPGHLDGLWRMLAPRAGPELTLDPLGLLLSAVAAGLGILLLTAGVLRASARVRLAVMGVATVAVVIVPTIVAIRVAAASGVYRAQDRWAVSLRPDTAPGLVQEAWSTSFRKDPPATLESGFGGPLREPRRITLAMIPILAALLLALVAPVHRPIALGLALLAPPIAVGTMFGSGALVVLTALAAAWWCAARRSIIAAAIAVGVALVGGAPGMAAYADGGWVNLALFCAGTGAAWWLAGIISGGAGRCERSLIVSGLAGPVGPGTLPEPSQEARCSAAWAPTLPFEEEVPMLMRALVAAVLPLLATQNCDFVAPPPPTREESCLASFTTWGVLGFAPEQVPELPDQLLKARIRVGEAASLRAERLGQPGECDDLVSGGRMALECPGRRGHRSRGPARGAARGAVSGRDRPSGPTSPCPTERSDGPSSMPSRPAAPHGCVSTRSRSRAERRDSCVLGTSGSCFWSRCCPPLAVAT